MLREKLKGRLLKPLLFLLALFAIQQTASAYSSMYLRSLDGNNYNFELQWNPATQAYEANNVSLTGTNLPFRLICTGDNNGEVAPAAAPAIYVIDNSGWNQLTIYTHADGVDGNFGGWSGKAPEETVTIDGVTYKKFLFPDTDNGKSYNVIFNNAGNGQQFDGPYIQSGKSYCYEITANSFTPRDVPNEANAGGSGDVTYSSAGEYYVWNTDSEQKITLATPGGNLYFLGGDWKVTVKTQGDAEGGVPVQMIVEKANGTVVAPVVDYYLRGQFNGWGENDANYKFGDGKLTMTYSTSQPQFRVNDLNPGVWPGREDVQKKEINYNTAKIGIVDNDYAEDRGYNFQLIGCPDGTTVTFTLDTAGELPYLDVTWDGGTTPVEPVEPVDPDAYNYIFLRSCADNWGDNIIEGFIWNSTTNAYELKNFHNAGNNRAYGVVISNGMNLNDKAVDYRWYFYGSGNTPFHIADNADIVLNPDPEDQVHREIYLDNEGWYNITVKTNGDVPTGAPVQFIITKVANPGMPFFPKGITNERDFRNLPADQEFYYLVCHNINDRKASPEWQMVETVPGSGEYTVDFTYNNHGDGDNGNCFNAGQADTFNVAFFTRDADAPKYKYGEQWQDIKVVGQGDGFIHKYNHHHAGVRLRATYKPADNTLTFNYLKQTNTGWEIADNNTDATYIPFISLVADKWTQPVPNGTKMYGEWAGDWLLPNDYQNAFIQYDENGEIVYSRHGNQVFYNTQWPPVNPIFIEKSFTSNGKEYDLVMDSDNLSFASTGDVKTGAKWAEEFGFNLDGGPYIEGVNHNETLFELYTVNDVWASGDFKLWSGWSGNRDGNQSAEWHKNWNWGHVNQNTTDAENIDNASLFFLGNRNGDVNFSAPTYIKTIRFFMATPNDPNGSAIGNDWGRSFIYLERAMGNVRIQALNNEDYTAGTFLPGLDADLLAQGTTISRINLSVYRSSDETEVGNLWNAIDRNIDPEKFYDAFGTPFTLSDYAETYYNDLFDYQSSGYYFYKMTVTFKDQYGVETSETVRSNPFYVSIATSSLVAAQLVEIVRDKDGKAVEERFDDYKYVTYTPGSPYEWGYLTDKAFEARKANYQQEEGRDETGLGRYGYRVEKINLNPTTNRDFYADADRALWTNKVLVYSLRPWKGEEPDMALGDAGAHGAYWEITRDKCHDHANWQEGPLEENTWYYGHVAQGNPTLSGDGNFEGLATNVEDLADLNFDAPLELIIDASCIYKHNFSVKLHYYPTREENETTAESSVAHDDMQLRIPTPRMRPVAFTGTMEDLSVEGENFGKIEIAAEDHTGNKTDEIAYQTNLYDNPRVRTLRFGAYMDMPNATPELIALIPDLGAKATEEQIAAGMMGNYWRKCEIDCAEDKGFEELLDGSFLNIKDMRYTRFRFLNQDLNYWLNYNAETNEYEPVKRNITFDFEYDRTGNGEILFFPRRANGVTFQLQSNLKAPEFAMKDGKIDATAYKVVIPKAGADNAMEEHLILSDVKTITDKDSYLELPGEENTPGSQQIEFTLNEDKAYYMFLLDKSLPVQSTEDGWAEHTRFSHHNNINTAAALYSVDRADRGPWYDGIEGTSVINKDFDVEIAHAYFFYVNRDIDFQHWNGVKWEDGGAVSKTPDNGAATQAAPQRASAADYQNGRYVAFVGPSRVATLNANDIMTGVENITAAGESIISGEGFIDMNGNLGAVYGVDGQLYYNGRGRVELPAGIYMVATEKTNAKVLVK